jgi:hypothetical protein
MRPLHARSVDGSRVGLDGCPKPYRQRPQGGFHFVAAELIDIVALRTVELLEQGLRLRPSTHSPKTTPPKIV